MKSQSTSRYRWDMIIPSIACSVHGRKRHTSIVDFEERLVLEVQGTSKARGNGLREASDRIMIDYGAGEQGQGVWERGDRCGEEKGEMEDVGEHLEGVASVEVEKLSRGDDENRCFYLYEAALCLYIKMRMSTGRYERTGEVVWCE